MRYGNVFCHSNRTDFEPEERDFSLPALGLMLVSMFPFLGYGLWDNFGTVVELFENENRFPLNETQLLRHKDAKGVRASNSYQVEAAVGGGLVFRLGFNVGELLDFILGWTTIDIFGDDLESRESREPRKIIATATPPVVKENSLTLKAPFVTHFIKPRDAEKERQRK
ncbi:MAG: hypothetical protein NTY53_18815, partial [Kiritimatiellaeota bacterium]|nr:hypothetical protein [Kiritimatiellota bacterium]